MADMPRAPELDVCVLSDPGTLRTENQDSHGTFAHDDCFVVAVADGVSGYPAGDTASQTAVEALARAFPEQPARLGAAKRLYRAVQLANLAVYDLGLVVPELRGMATTLTAVVIDGGLLAAAHVGDSRLYRIRGSSI